MHAKTTCIKYLFYVKKEQSKPESYPHGGPFSLFLPSPHMSTSAGADQHYEIKKSKHAAYGNQGEGPDMLCYSGWQMRFWETELDWTKDG